MFSNTNSNHVLGGGPPSMFKTIYSKFSWTMVMYIILIILFILIIVYFYRQSSVNANNSSNYKINRENMNGQGGNTGKGNAAELILFYVDWCPHCKTAKPEWESLKSQYEGKTINGYNVIFTEYNCTNESAEIEQLINKFKIEGYPTVKLIKDNQIIEYDAKPTKATMEEFLNTVL
jgi:thiol-disulfide isomerase/thioredoxin